MNLRQLPVQHTPGWITVFIFLVLAVNIGMWFGISEFGHLRVITFVLMIEAQFIGAVFAVLFVKG